MKLNTQKSNIQSGGVNLEVHYRIEANKKSFDVLSGDMYSHIIPTIVRELSSNAFDAHIEAETRGELGQSRVPFTVGCPSAFDPYFTVADEGIGLRYFKYNARARCDANKHMVGDVTSTLFIDGDIRELVAGIDTIILTHEGSSQTIYVPSYLYDKSKDETCLRIAGEYRGDNFTVEFDDTLVLYSTYFKSTKEETDDYIGGYGLGAKTPLAYTSNFMVTNRFNGVERVYSIYKNEDGMPCINLMGTVDTDAHNGMEVKLGVSSQDYSKFKDAIEDQLKYFDPQPTILNDVVDMPKVIHRGKYFLLMDRRTDSGGYYRSGTASVGYNSYSVDHINSHIFRQGKVALKFNIGEVKVAASREALKYDSETVKMISQRETDALNEYREYVLDSIDTTDMEDYERAAFLNEHSQILDLSCDRVREMVGNPHYRYSSDSITIPISGWGEYTNLKYTDDYDLNYVDGVSPVGRSLKPHLCTRHKTLRWRRYDTRTGKTSSNTVGSVDPVSPLVAFVRDNSFSFLKKIAYYVSEHDLKDHEIMVVDPSNTESAADALDIVKSLIGHCTTFVNMSSITLPKNLSLAPSSGYTTPTARLFDVNNHSFSYPQEWSDVYTPLTKIDTDAYIIRCHRGEFDSLDDTDVQFLKGYINADHEWDEDVTVLALSRARYEKALTYGFKPFSELLDSLKHSVTIPVDAVHAELAGTICNAINGVNLIRILERVEKDKLKEIKTGSVTKLLRLRSILNARYINGKAGDNYRKTNRLRTYMKEVNVPKPMDVMSKTLDAVSELCDNINVEFELIEDLSIWSIPQSGSKVDALIEYINFIGSKVKSQENENE